MLTAIAFAIAAVAVVFAWSIRRAEAQRSNARIAALSAAIDPPAGGPEMMFFSSEQQPDGPTLQPASSTSSTPALRFVAIVAITTTLTASVAIGVAAYRTFVAGAPAREPAARLELLSMRHERSGDALTITGLVGNRGRTPVRAVTAVVLAFDAGGSFIADGRTPLDLPSLAPGEQSPFQVVLRNASAVGRYRVSFRDEEGLVPHDDRRARPAGAAPAAPFRPGPASQRAARH